MEVGAIGHEHSVRPAAHGEPGSELAVAERGRARGFLSWRDRAGDGEPVRRHAGAFRLELDNGGGAAYAGERLARRGVAGLSRGGDGTGLADWRKLGAGRRD